MNKTKFEDNLESRAQFFKALGHPVRLLILNLVHRKPRHGEELAAILNLNPATISHHLQKLTRVGLLTSQKDQYYQTYSLVGNRLDQKISDLVHLPQPGLEIDTATDAYRQKVLRSFFKHGRLKSIPVQLKKRLVILEKIVQEFEPEREYSEHAVNQILLEFHEDVATLRRELIDRQLMARKRSQYWRL
ncbi:metalloregulator ArsR/SmtB family transcription factor [candidate division CSSED10-310 bacterium]|uniref:Metalloregulator ArsR/SmtB family transcription factor n=1 Tax=candidate division CSSED10-310 bacterium TaxID=2855610 RepID=A0ABV6YWT2_UNCC1